MVLNTKTNYDVKSKPPPSQIQSAIIDFHKSIPPYWHWSQVHSTVSALVTSPIHHNGPDHTSKSVVMTLALITSPFYGNGLSQVHFAILALVTNPIHRNGLSQIHSAVFALITNPIHHNALPQIHSTISALITSPIHHNGTSHKSNPS